MSCLAPLKASSAAQSGNLTAPLRRQTMLPASLLHHILLTRVLPTPHQDQQQLLIRLATLVRFWTTTKEI